DVGTVVARHRYLRVRGQVRVLEVPDEAMPGVRLGRATEILTRRGLGSDAATGSVERRRLRCAYPEPGQSLITGGQRVGNADRRHTVVAGTKFVAQPGKGGFARSAGDEPRLLERAASPARCRPGSQLVQAHFQVSSTLLVSDQERLPKTWH